MSSISRFNPKTGALDFWNEFRKPNPFRVPMLLASTIPPLIIGYWLMGEVHYKTPERPQITYITTFDPGRTDEEIIASNQAAQEVKELREADDEARANRKRDTYKALGAAMGMDVDRIAAEADERRAAEEAAAAKASAERLSKSLVTEGEGSGSSQAPEGSRP